MPRSTRLGGPSQTGVTRTRPTTVVNSDVRFLGNVKVAEGHDLSVDDDVTAGGDVTAGTVGAGTITALGELAAGGSVTADNVPAGGLNAWLPSDSGFKAWAYDPSMATGSTVVTGGTLYLVRLNLREATLITNLHFGVAAVAITPTAGANEVCVYNSAGARQGTAVSADTSVLTLGLMSHALSTPVTLGPGFCWVAGIFAGSTVVGLARSSNGQAAAFHNAGLTAVTARNATAGTGVTDLPASITPASNTLLQNTIWAAVS